MMLARALLQRVLGKAVGHIDRPHVDAVLVGVTDDLTGRFSAVDLVRVASAALGGQGGGGRPDMAQAGGPDGAKASVAIDAVSAALAGTA